MVCTVVTADSKVGSNPKWKEHFPLHQNARDILKN